MKKFLKIVLTIVVVFLICLVLKLNILDFSAFKVEEQRFSNYSGHYFKQLNVDEKEIYIKIDDAVKSIRKTVFLGMLDSEGLSDKVGKILIAYFYDNPHIYYLSNRYVVATSDVKLFEISTLELNYIINTKEEIESKNKQLDSAISEIISSNITEDMTDYERELAIHDALVDKVTYYNYENIEDIPCIKHTAYGALVENEAVCDGYSKAFKLLLEKVGIDNVIIHGSTEDVAHAWNVVSLDGEYYHVDTTSDKLDMTKKYVIHTYFNLTDKQIFETHSINQDFIVPQCNSERYNYYNKQGYTILNQDNLYNKLDVIITKQKKSKILEIKLDNKYTVKRLIDTLYDLDFNNWRSNRENSVEYTQVQDKYIFVK